jgi:hypothetical protein
MFQFIQASWDTGTKSFFEKLPRKNVQVNAPCSHTHSFCVIGLSSGLANKYDLDSGVTVDVGQCITRGWICFSFYSSSVICHYYWVAF